MLRILRSSGGSDKSLNKTIILTVTALGEVDESVSLKVKTQHLLHLVLNAAKSTATALELAHIREN